MHRNHEKPARNYGGFLSLSRTAGRRDNKRNVHDNLSRVLWLLPGRILSSSNLARDVPAILGFGQEILPTINGKNSFIYKLLSRKTGGSFVTVPQLNYLPQ